MDRTVLISALACCLGIGGAQSFPMSRETKTSFTPMTAAQKNQFLAASHSNKKVSGGAVVFSTRRLSGSGSDGLLLHAAFEVDAGGATFDSNRVTTTVASVYLQYTPSARSKSHLVVATIVATRSGTFKFEDTETHQNTTVTVSKGKTGHLSLIEPENARYFSLFLSPQNQADNAFVFKQISVEELK